MYEALILLPHANVRLEDAQHLLEVRFAADAAIRVSRRSGRVEVRVQKWVLKVALNLESHVPEEASEIAQMLQTNQCTASSPEVLERARNAPLETYPARLEVSSQPDPNMDHFNMYLFVLEALAALEGSIAFDPSSAMFV